MKKHSTARRRWFAWIDGLLPAQIRRSRSSTRSAKGARPRVESLEDRLAPATVTWNIAGSGSWNVANNWSPARVPTSTDTAVINTVSAATITITAGEQVLSVTTASTDTLSITGGGLTVTSGTSTLSGPLSMTGGTLTANGSTVNLSASTTTTVSQATLIAQAGATLSLPNLHSYVSNGTYFQATGAGSVLNVAALATLTQQGTWTVYAQNGGEVKLSAITALTSTHGIGINETGNSTLLDLGRV